MSNFYHLPPVVSRRFVTHVHKTTTFSFVKFFVGQIKPREGEYFDTHGNQFCNETLTPNLKTTKNPWKTNQTFIESFPFSDQKNQVDTHLQHNNSMSRRLMIFTSQLSFYFVRSSFCEDSCVQFLLSDSIKAFAVKFIFHQLGKKISPLSHYLPKNTLL